MSISTSSRFVCESVSHDDGVSAAGCTCCFDPAMAASTSVSRRSLLRGIGLATAASAIGGGAFAQAPATQLAQTAPPVREISQIRDNLYRFRNNFHYSVFAVISAGVIATDPINADAARWLKEEIARRFNQPIRYVIYSHDHADHISGGQILAEQAIVVAHDNAKSVIVGEKRPTAVPNLTFSDAMTIELGGTVVDLKYVGRNHSDNSLVMIFPKVRTLFAVDFIPVNSVPFRDFPDAYLGDWIQSLKAVEAMDFDTLAPGHGPLGTKDHVRQYRTYMEELRDQVLTMARAGKSLDEMKATIKMEKYKDWSGYEQMLALNVEGMHRLVQTNRRGN
jgi:glyoxylase-like metal-dependent hydrolase (beta-lactamase superfamily II)